MTPGAEQSHGEPAGRLVADGGAAAAASRGSAELPGYGPCKKCFHGVRSHSPRSGLCGVAGCKCEVFDGPGIQPWEVEDGDVPQRLAGRSPEIHAAELEDPIDYEHGVRVLSHAKPIDDEVFIDHVEGLENALLFIRDTASERPESTDVIFTAARAALCEWWDHKDSRESISVYAARVAGERDVAVNALAQIVAEFDGHETDPVLYIARAALRQIAEPWTRARGALPRKPGEPRAEERIRRIRGESS